MAARYDIQKVARALDEKVGAMSLPDRAGTLSAMVFVMMNNHPDCRETVARWLERMGVDTQYLG